MRQSRREAGQDLIEYALILPVLLAVMMGIAETALIGFQYVNVANAAREGARRGIVTVGSDALIQLEAENAARASAAAAGLNTVHLAIAVPPAALNEGKVEVQATYQMQLILAPMVQAIGGGSAGPFTLSASSTMRR